MCWVLELTPQTKVIALKKWRTDQTHVRQKRTEEDNALLLPTALQVFGCQRTVSWSDKVLLSQSRSWLRADKTGITIHK